ncbi:MAG: hypothetical protein HZB84_10025 [Deltaproteobacteria bacterium]|nr:hypothetical protein [Deltaproteobacteria bacterium]
MAKRIFVDHVWCKEETDEIGSDDVYIVVFRGNTTPPFSSNVAVHGPGDFWDDFDSGDEWSQDIPVAKFYPSSVYVVMLVEEDVNRDISGSDVIGAWKSQTDLTWKSIMLSMGGGSLTAGQKASAAQGIANTMMGLSSIYMEFPKGNDDIIGAPKQIVIQEGQKPVVEFKGDGGHYKIRFKVA